MNNYLLLCDRIMRFGRKRGDRTGTGTRSIRSANLVWDLREGFPLVTTKKVNLQSVFHELAWILSGDTNVEYLRKNNCAFIWEPWSLSEPVTKRKTLSNPDRLDWLRKNRPDLYAVWNEERLYQAATSKGVAFLDQHEVPTAIDYVTIPAGETNAPYGPAWRRWKGRDGETIDQIQYLLDTLRTNPESRRILLSAWDPANLPDESISPQENVKQGKPCLTPCHWAIELYTDAMTPAERISWLVERNPLLWDKWVKNDEADPDGELLAKFLDTHEVPKHFLDLKWHQRSVDAAIGLPFNIASYALLLTMFAKTLGMEARELEFDGTNVHIYENHLPGIVQQFSRTPRQLPSLTLLNKRERLEDYVWEDVALTHYDPHPFIKFEVSV